MGLTFYYHEASPPCRMVLFGLRAMNVDYKLHVVDFANNELQSDAFLEVNIRGKMPAILDGSINLGESRAILQYLGNKYDTKGEFYPKEADKRARVDQVLAIDSDTMDAMYKYVKPFPVLFLGQKPGLGDEPEMHKALAVYEKLLSKTKFLAGETMTIADMAAVASLSILDLCEYSNFCDFPNLKKWLDGMKAHPLYKESVGDSSETMTKMYQAKLKSN